MSSKTYSNSVVQLSWRGIDFKEGLVAGGYFGWARTTPTTSSKANLRGDSIISISADGRCTITVTVNQSSDLHQRLLDICYEDRASNTRTGGEMVFTDISTGRVMTFADAYIVSEADESWALEESDIPWTFEANSLVVQNPRDNRNLLQIG